MIRVMTGDILEAKLEALVNPCNCVGIMGKGLALQVKNRYPRMFQAYKKACDSWSMNIGQMNVFDYEWGTPRYIINFPTKFDWRDVSRYEYINRGLDALIHEIRRLRIESLALPAVGCGLGGLRWPCVYSLIELALAPLPSLVVHVYAPRSTTYAHRLQAVPKRA